MKTYLYDADGVWGIPPLYCMQFPNREAAGVFLEKEKWVVLSEDIMDDDLVITARSGFVIPKVPKDESAPKKEKSKPFIIKL